MKIKGISHDHRYKTIFSDPVMVESLVREFTPKEFVADLDFSSLIHISGTYEADDGSERINDMFSLPDLSLSSGFAGDGLYVGGKYRSVERTV